MLHDSGTVEPVISEVKILFLQRSTQVGGLVGFASCMYAGLKLDSIGIISREDGGIRLSYPTRKLGNGQQFFYFYPTSNEVGEEIHEAVMMKYDELISERKNDYGLEE